MTDSDNKPVTIVEDAFKEFYGSETFPCVICGKEITLHWNGGELDSPKTCRGMEYEVHARGYYVTATASEAAA